MRRAPLPPLERRPGRAITDAEVLERVAGVLEVDLADLDGRRLRRLNSAVNRYRLERRALKRTGTAHRYTSRAAVARALYGPGVDLDDVKRQLRRVEADLQAAGLLRVRPACTAAGQSAALLVELLEPETMVQPYPGNLARRHLARRAETRAECARARVGPWRRQQSDRRPRGGVPGLYVRRSSSQRIAPPGSSAPLGRGLRHTAKSERDARAARRRPDPAPRSRRSSAPHDGRAEKATPPRHRYAALSGLRQIALREGGRDALRRAAREGAPVCSIAVAAWEATFIADVPGSWVYVGNLNPPPSPELLERHPALGLGPPPPAPGTIGLSAKWSRRLEAACRLFDRQAGQPGAGIAWFLTDLWAWEPAHGTPCRYAEVEFRAGGWPATLAYFVARLVVEARAMRRRGDPARRARSFDWRLD